MFDHRREVAVVMQECVAVLDAVSADDEIIGFADRNAEASKAPKILGRAYRDISVQKVCVVESQQRFLNSGSVDIVPRTLEYFQQNEVTDDHPIGILDLA